MAICGVQISCVKYRRQNVHSVDLYKLLVDSKAIYCSFVNKRAECCSQVGRSELIVEYSRRNVLCLVRIVKIIGQVC